MPRNFRRSVVRMFSLAVGCARLRQADVRITPEIGRIIQEPGRMLQEIGRIRQELGRIIQDHR